MYFCANFSSILVVIISIEKFIALYFPFKTKTICTVPIAKRVSLVTAIFLILYNAQFLYIGGHVKDPDGNLYCDYVNISVTYYKILAYMLMTLYIFGPFVIMIVANFAITYKFMMAKLHSRSTESTNQALSKSAMKGTAMLLTVSFGFIILMGPIGIANLLWVKIPDLVFGIAVTLEYINHGINGFLYCISGTRFRTELMKTLGCFKKGSTTGTSRGTATVISELNSFSFPT